MGRGEEKCIPSCDWETYDGREGLENVSIDIRIISNCMLKELPVPIAACGIRGRSAAPCLLRSWVRIPLGAWMYVCCECCVSSGRGRGGV